MQPLVSFLLMTVSFLCTEVPILRKGVSNLRALISTFCIEET